MMLEFLRFLECASYCLKGLGLITTYCDNFTSLLNSQGCPMILHQISTHDFHWLRSMHRSAVRFVEGTASTIRCIQILRLTRMEWKSHEVSPTFLVIADPLEMSLLDDMVYGLLMIMGEIQLCSQAQVVVEDRADMVYFSVHYSHFAVLTLLTNRALWYGTADQGMVEYLQRAQEKTPLVVDETGFPWHKCLRPKPCACKVSAEVNHKAFNVYKRLEAAAYKAQKSTWGEQEPWY